MKNLLIFTVHILLGSLQIACNQPKPDNLSKKEEDQFVINSKILGETRTCLISLPETYFEVSEKDEKYPVIILLDGNVFFKTTAGAVQFMSSDSNRNHLMPKSIIVAVENVDRERDFTVTKLKTKRPNTMGGGKKFLGFIQKELLPYLDTNYRTKKSRTLIGHSLGGLLTLNAYMDENNIFDAYLAIDPSIWWDEETIKNKVDSVPSTSLNKKLFIATANQGEANYERNKKRHDTLYSLLRERMEGGNTVSIQYYETENHRSVPLKAIYDGLKYLNGDTQ
ncbi:alpha/beta hydrolase [Flagellimonas sp. GZD32]|uniref:alpha/beta hydrolase n=1 Tax=Flagellimonas cixiensis TaxID=3228750 RepID=UPI0035C8F5C3